MTLTLTIPLWPWWLWALLAFGSVYGAGVLWIWFSSRSLRLGLIWPLWLLFAALGAGPQ